MAGGVGRGPASQGRAATLRRRLAGRVVAALGAVVLLNAVFGAGIGAQDGELTALGRDLYNSECAICHGDAGRGIEGQGPPLVGVGAASVDFMLRTGRMPPESADAPLRRRPPRYDQRQRRALVAFVTTFAGEGPAIPDVNPQAGDLGHGRALFVTNCAACHGPTAEGIAVGQRDVSSDLRVAGPLEIAEAIRTGPGVMPVFGPETLDQHDLDSVTAWVLHLRDRASPGGITVGRVGPVSEGLVAWVVGMGLLVAIAYLLGDKETGARPEASDE